MTASYTIGMPISSFLPNLGGVEVGLHNIAGKMLERGHRPVVMAPVPHVARLKAEGWRLPYPVEALPPKVWSLLRLAPWMGFWVLDHFFARMQRRYRFDCWHCTVGYPTGVALAHFAARRRDIRYLIRCAGEDIQRDPEIGYGARLDRRVDRLVRDYLRRATVLVAISDSVADEYRALGVADECIRPVPNGVDLTRFEGAVDRRAVRARYGLDPDVLLLLAVGRNHPKKNYATLLEATARLSADPAVANYPFHVLIVGNGVADLRQHVEALGLSGCIKLVEQIGHTEAGVCSPQLPAPALVDLYRAADVFVFPSLIETFGIAIVEAMAAGLPVVVGDSPGCRDVVRGGCDGVLVQPRDTAVLAAAMALMITDNDVRRAYGTKARKRAEDFSWDRVADSYTSLYEELAGPQPAGEGDGTRL